jgi:hypothetical protein
MTPLKSLDQSGQKGCPSVRKSIRFQFDAGPLTIQISGTTAEHISVGLFKPNNERDCCDPNQAEISRRLTASPGTDEEGSIKPNRRGSSRAAYTNSH